MTNASKSRQTADQRSYGAQARREDRDLRTKNFIFAIVVAIVAIILLGYLTGVTRDLSPGMNTVRQWVACANAKGNPESQACRQHTHDRKNPFGE